MTAMLDRETKDAALTAMFGRMMFLGLAFASVEDEDTDPAYERQMVFLSDPQDDPDRADRRIVTNTATIRFPFNVEDGASDIRIMFLADAAGDIRWHDRIERPRRLVRGDAIVLEPGDLKIGIGKGGQ